MHDLTSLKTITFAAAPMGSELHTDFEAYFKAITPKTEVLQQYAMTEMLGGFQYPLKDRKHKPGSSGQVAPNLELKLIKISGSDGKHVPPHTRGEILLRGPYRMKEYRNNTEATNELVDEEGFVHTGDVAYYDEDGYVFIVDRIKDLIKYMGQQVSASEIEEVILQHPAVKETAVIAIPAELEGEFPAAVVVSKANSHISEEELLNFVNSKVADHKKLRGGVIFIDQLPRNPQGKLLRAELRQKYKNHQPPQIQRKNISKEIRKYLEKEEKDKAKQAIVGLITEVVELEILGVKSEKENKIYLEESLIEQGMNSSGAVLLRNALASSLSLSLPITIVFEYPAPAALAQHLLALLDDPAQHKRQLLAQVQNDIQQIISEIDLKHLSANPLPNQESVRKILVTGATGFVGCHLLAELLRATRATIHCVVRAADDRAAHERVMNKLHTQTCWTPDAESRIVAHAGDLSAQNLGIATQALAFFEQVDAIYHVGAVVNWVLPYSQMRENLTGGAEILKMIARAGRRIPFHLISTISAIHIDLEMKERLKEKRGEEEEIKGFGGYPLSKWAGEQIIIHARSQGLPVTIFRLPLVGPHSKTGAANMEDELTRSILSCIEIGCVPILSSSLPPFVSMAVDELVLRTVSLSFDEKTFFRPLVQFSADKGPSWYHIFETLHQTNSLAKIPLSQWTQKIRAKPSTPLSPILEAVVNQFTTSRIGDYSVQKLRSILSPESVEEITWKLDDEIMRKIVEFTKTQKDN